MTLTPVDIRDKQFKRGVRGYMEVEVDEFLDQVVDEFERMAKESIELSERLKVLEEKSKACRPIFQGRNFQRDPDLCFVLMPFRETWSERIWRHRIKPTVESVGMKCKRADDVLRPGVIVEDIWSAINIASVVVADLTGKNPNVFYELGLAHVVGVPAVLLSQEHEMTVFDTAHHRQIRYQDSPRGCDLLQEHLRAALTGLRARTMFT
jgi:DivIVA domain-containing protein